MTVAFLFPGQAMDEPAMGIGATASGHGRRLLERASEAAGLDLRRLLVEGGAALRRTEVLQPLLAAVCLALHRALAAAGVAPYACAGHSVGELFAWAAAGGLDDETAIDLAALRGRLMAREAARHPGGMLALLGATDGEVEKALAIGGGLGAIDLAALNAPGQTVLAGEAPALAAVARRFPSRRLDVAGAWHGATMAGAHDELLAALVAAPRRPLGARLIAGRTGRFVDDGEATPALVAGQLVHPVQWSTALRSLASAGITDYVTVGPGRVLRSLVRQNLGGAARVHSAFDLDEVARFVERRVGSHDSSHLPASASASASAPGLSRVMQKKPKAEAEAEAEAGRKKCDE